MSRIVQNRGVVLAGLVVGLAAVCLGIFGNPANMAFCIACFTRDIAGALGLHRDESFQYLRPEIPGIILGAFVLSRARREHAPQSGSSPLTRFLLGICVMVGALIFLGCPLRMVLRIAGGDMNAVVGLVGFVGGILTGVAFLNRGFSLRRSYDQPKIEGVLIPALSALLLTLLTAAPALLFFSVSGPGASRAPIIISLAFGLIVGAAAQRSRLCIIGGVRDAALFRDTRMLICVFVIFAVVLIGNVITGKFHLGFEHQPLAHTQWVWNILGVYLVGFGSVLLGGCPLRQLVLAGSGSGDAGVTLLGYVAGAALSHNFGIVSTETGTTKSGRAAFVICLAAVFAVAVSNTKKPSGKRGVAA
jgi:YedE family putative selenium metabolism protein